MKKNLFFSSPPRIFSNMSTLTKHCILRYESYFFVFSVVVFFSSKKWSKNECKIGPRKTIKKMAQLGPKMVPKLIKSELENPENLQNGPKKYFFEGSIFWLFFDLFFHEFLVSRATPGASQNRQFSAFFRLFLKNCARPGPGEVRRPLRDPPGTILGCFLVDL